jgi:hypothetical protein
MVGTHTYPMTNDDETTVQIQPVARDSFPIENSISHQFFLAQERPSARRFPVML